MPFTVYTLAIINKLPLIYIEWQSELFIDIQTFEEPIFVSNDKRLLFDINLSSIVEQSLTVWAKRVKPHNKTLIAPNIPINKCLIIQILYSIFDLNISWKNK